MLGSIRDEVRKVAAENRFVEVASGGNAATNDPNGDLTKRKLALLNWDTAVIDQLIAVLNSTSPDAAGIAMVTRHMRRFSVPRYVFQLDEPLPAQVVFTGALKNKIYHDVAANSLNFIGVMTEAEQTALMALSSDPAYQTAIDELFAAPDRTANAPTGTDIFITSTDAGTMFAAGSTPAARFIVVLKKLLPYLRTTLSEQIVIQLVSEYLGLDSSAARELLTNRVNSTADASQKAISLFIATSFADSNPNVEVSRDDFCISSTCSCGCIRSRR